MSDGTDHAVAPERQVHAHIAIGRAVAAAGGLFGRELDMAAGGGGDGGRYVFADLAEFDHVIAEWETLWMALHQDRRAILRAIEFVEAPADDPSSREQAEATSASLLSLREHTSQMIEYVARYLVKLKAARGATEAVEQINELVLGGVDRGPR